MITASNSPTINQNYSLVMSCSVMEPAAPITLCSSASCPVIKPIADSAIMTDPHNAVQKVLRYLSSYFPIYPPAMPPKITHRYAAGFDCSKYLLGRS